MERKAFEYKLSSVDKDEDGKMIFSGYGAVFGNVDAYGDVIVKGAFADSLAEYAAKGTMPLMCLNHNLFGELPIGKWLTIEEDDYGLKVTGELLETTQGKDTYVALKASALNGLSIGFIAKEWSLRQSPDEPRRTIYKIDLIEISVVNLPANDKALVDDVKSVDETLTVRDLENILRQSGLSKSQAVMIASKFQSKAPVEHKDNDAAFDERIKKLLSR